MSKTTIELIAICLFVAVVINMLSIYIIGIIDYVDDNQRIMQKYHEQIKAVQLCNDDDLSCMVRESEELFDFINKIEGD